MEHKLINFYLFFILLIFVFQSAKFVKEIKFDYFYKCVN